MNVFDMKFSKVFPLLVPRRNARDAGLKRCMPLRRG